MAGAEESRDRGHHQQEGVTTGTDAGGGVGSEGREVGTGDTDWICRRHNLTDITLMMINLKSCFTMDLCLLMMLRSYEAIHSSSMSMKSVRY